MVEIENKQNQQETLLYRLMELRDPQYAQFQSGLLPTLDRELVLGVRVPVLRKLAKEVRRQPQLCEAFLAQLPHRYYDENMLHGLLIAEIRDYDQCVAALEQFLPFVDNWAVCDTMSPKVLKTEPERLMEQIRLWIGAKHPYTCRFGLLCLMRYYLDDAFQPQVLELAARVEDREHYYVKMMVAWFFATALAKQWEAAVVYLEQRRLSPWIHSKTIQKACESYRITREQKAYLKGLKEKSPVTGQ